MANGRLEAQVTVPSGGWDLSATHSTEGAQTITIPAGEYFWSDLTSGVDELYVELEDQLNAAFTANYTVSLSSSGVITMSVDSGTFAVSWTDVELRNLFGFTGDLSTASSHVAPGQVEAMWLPLCPARPPFGATDEGWYEFDAVTTEGPGGGDSVVSTAYNEKTVNSLVWSHVESSRAIGTANTSFMQFYRDGVFGSAPWGTSGGPVRWYPDSSASDVTKYRVPVESRLRPEQVFPGSDTFYRVSIPRMVKV